MHTEHNPSITDFTQTIELRIDGEWYSWPTRGVPGYQMADISPFTARTSTGQVKLSDLVGIAVLEQSGWVTGSGQYEFIETARYAYGDHVWSPDGTTGLTVGPYYEKTDDTYLVGARTSANHSGAFAKLVPIQKPWYGSSSSTKNDKQYVLLSTTDKLYVGEVKPELGLTLTDVTGDLLSKVSPIPFPNHDFEDAGVGTPNWFDTSDANVSGTKSIVTVGSTKSLQLDVQEASPGAALVGERYNVHSEYVPVPTDALIQYQVATAGTCNSGYDSWRYYLEVTPVIYDVTKGQYVKGVKFSEEIPVNGNVAFAHTTAAFTPDFGSLLSSATVKSTSQVWFLEINIAVEVEVANPAATQIQFDYVNLNVASVNHIFIYDIFYNGLTILAATNFGILYAENTADVLDLGSLATWKRASEFALVAAKQFATYDGFLWYAEADTAILHYGASPMGEDLEARTTNNMHPAYWFSKDGSTGLGDAGAVIVGDPTDRIVAIAEYNQKLWVFKEKSIYYIYNNSGVYTPIKISVHDYDKDNFASVVYYDGALIYYKNGRVYRFLESSIVDITPPVEEEYDRIMFASGSVPSVRGFTVVGPYLYAVDTQNNIRVYDGAGWHSFLRASALNATASSGAWTGTFVGGVLYLYANSGTTKSVLIEVAVDENGPTKDWELLRVPLPTLPTGYVVTSWVDGGLPNIDKHFHSVVVEAAFEFDEGYIDVEFVVDDGDGNYRSYGPKRIDAPNYPSNVALFGSTIMDKRLYKIRLPNDFVGRRIRAKFTLVPGVVAGANVSRPHMWRWLLNYVPRPFTIYGYAPTILITHTSKVRSNLTKSWTPRDQIDLLLKARDSRAPIQMRDPITNTIRDVYVSAVKVQPIVRRTKGSVQDETFIAEISLVEFKL